MLTGVRPFEDATETSESEPSARMRRTETWLLPGSVARRYRPSVVRWRPPAEPNGAPVPAPPASNGEPSVVVREPSAWRSNPATEFRVAVLLLT